MHRCEDDPAFEPQTATQHVSHFVCIQHVSFDLGKSVAKSSLSSARQVAVPAADDAALERSQSNPSNTFLIAFVVAGVPSVGAAASD